MEKTGLLLTCEHGGNHVPEGYRQYFQDMDDLLNSHRGYDTGALHMAQSLSSVLCSPLVSTTVTRLLVDCNRSLHRKTLFSKITRHLGEAEKKDILEKYYFPYRNEANLRVQELIGEYGRVVHLSVHSFTPVLKNRKRKTDVGILYDPKRAWEYKMAKELQKKLKNTTGLRVWRNYPFRGWPDGLVAAFRKIYPDNRYTGIELEMNQQLYIENNMSWGHLPDNVAECIKTC
ncbi:MAG: N-formylglutamate amidohydrolase [Spirochaetota bacterium]